MQTSTSPAPTSPATVRAEARRVAWTQPMQWLRRGWADFMRCLVPGLLHGLAVAAFGAVLLAFAYQRFWLLAGAFSGFLLVAPVVVTGLYEISRQLERGARPTLADALRAWNPSRRRMVVFGLLLALAGTGWVLTSASLITGFASGPVNNPQDFVQRVVLDEHSHLFEIWMLLGGVLAAPVFASSVVALPMLLDQPQARVMDAVLASWRAVLENPVTLAAWAGILLLGTLVGMVTGLAGLVVIVPWLAHASWHAYRDLIVIHGAAPAAAPTAG